MPCYDGRENERQVLCTYEHEARIRADCRHNSDVAELLCGVMKQLALHGQDTNMLVNNRSLRIWWAEHQKRDAKKAKRR